MNFPQLVECRFLGAREGNLLKSTVPKMNSEMNTVQSLLQADSVKWVNVESSLELRLKCKTISWGGGGGGVQSIKLLLALICVKNKNKNKILALIARFSKMLQTFWRLEHSPKYILTRVHYWHLKVEERRSSKESERAFDCWQNLGRIFVADA
jgi:hypothetical protein